MVTTDLVQKLPWSVQALLRVIWSIYSKNTVFDAKTSYMGNQPTRPPIRGPNNQSDGPSPQRTTKKAVIAHLHTRAQETRRTCCNGRQQLHTQLKLSGDRTWARLELKGTPWESIQPQRGTRR
jgi:hypothetical protein